MENKLSAKKEVKETGVLEKILEKMGKVIQEPLNMTNIALFHTLALRYHHKMLEMIGSESLTSEESENYRNKHLQLVDDYEAKWN